MRWNGVDKVAREQRGEAHRHEPQLEVGGPRPVIHHLPADAERVLHHRARGPAAGWLLAGARACVYCRRARARGCSRRARPQRRDSHRRPRAPRAAARAQPDPSPGAHPAPPALHHRGSSRRSGARVPGRGRGRAGRRARALCANSQQPHTFFAVPFREPYTLNISAPRVRNDTEVSKSIARIARRIRARPKIGPARAARRGRPALNPATHRDLRTAPPVAVASVSHPNRLHTPRAK